MTNELLDYARKIFREKFGDHIIVGYDEANKNFTVTANFGFFGEDKNFSSLGFSNLERLAFGEATPTDFCRWTMSPEAYKQFTHKLLVGGESLADQLPFLKNSQYHEKDGKVILTGIANQADISRFIDASLAEQGDEFTITIPQATMESFKARTAPKPRLANAPAAIKELPWIDRAKQVFAKFSPTTANLLEQTGDSISFVIPDKDELKTKLQEKLPNVAGTSYGNMFKCLDKLLKSVHRKCNKQSMVSRMPNFTEPRELDAIAEILGKNVKIIHLSGSEYGITGLPINTTPQSLAESCTTKEIPITAASITATPLLRFDLTTHQFNAMFDVNKGREVGG